jgi:ParB family chromosome partitioning protein
VKKRGLGKGLDALLATRVPENEPAVPAQEGDELRLLPVDLVDRSPYQPRQDFNKEALRELADSIRAQGIVQPILVRPAPSPGRFELIAGERRWRAAQLAGLHEVPALVRRIEDRAAMCLSLIENIQRQDLNPLEQAQALGRLVEEFDMTHDTVAEAVGRSRSTVTNLLRLLDLEPAVKQLVESRQLEMGHARALLALSGARQVEAARRVVAEGLSVRETEALVRRLADEKPKRKPGKPVDPDIRRLEVDLSERLGAGVAIRHDRSGSGRLEIRYGSLDQLDEILKRIK